MIALRPLALAMCGLPLLAGCVQNMQYVKPSVSAGQAELERRECAELAWREAKQDRWRYSFAYGYGQHPYYGGYRYRWPYAFQANAARERDLLDFCMRSRGYTLAPVE
ncbi:MAG: hypothetical protein OHK0024_07250 [Thalassobaculales bacterium]